ncbi:54S ribosomal protein L6 mitochondrial [Saitoella coloradoensis]
MFASLRPSSQSVRLLARSFSATPATCSHIGAAPIPLPPAVTVTPTPTGDIPDLHTIKGPLGSMKLPIPAYLKLHHDEAAQKLKLTCDDTTVKKHRAMYGTTRALLSNHITGVSEGHSVTIRFVGVGYRGSIETSSAGKPFVSLKIGFANPVEMPVPEGVKVTFQVPTKCVLEGVDKQLITQFAAKIRAWRKPEPYNQKGIFVGDETIEKKEIKRG